MGKENLSVAVLALANVLQPWGVAMQIMCLSVGMSTVEQRMFTRISHVQIHGQFPHGRLVLNIWTVAWLRLLGERVKI